MNGVVGYNNQFIKTFQAAADSVVIVYLMTAAPEGDGSAMPGGKLTKVACR